MNENIKPLTSKSQGKGFSKPICRAGDEGQG
jgi:hypothetical protein